MSDCTERIMPIAARIVRALLQLPSEKLRQEVQTPVRTVTDNGASLSYLKRDQIRFNLAHHHEHFRSAAIEVGKILSECHDITSLARGAGPTFDTEEQTAGARFLGRLIDAAIGGVEKPTHVMRKLHKISHRFEAQLNAGEIEVVWVYPLPGLSLEAPLRLSDKLRIEKLDESRMQLLHSYTEGGLVSDTMLLQTESVLLIRAVAQMPFGHSGAENADVLNRIVLAFILSDISTPLFLTSWPEPLEPTVFELGSATWFSPWSSSPLAFVRRVPIGASQTVALKRVYRAVEAASTELLTSLPMQRMISAAHRDNYEDRLIDLWIALESLLLRSDESSELQYRMSLRAAWLVRAPVFRDFDSQFKKAYGDRSKIVHGGRQKKTEGIEERYKWAFALLKKILLGSIQEKSLPDPRRIEEELLSGRSSRKTRHGR